MAVAAVLLGVGWTTSPLWGVFTDRLPGRVAWTVPSAQSTWPAGFALAVVAVAVLVRLRWSRRSGGLHARFHRSPRVPVAATVAAVLVCAATVLVPGVLGRTGEHSPGVKDAGTVRILSVNTWYHQASDAVLAATARDYEADIVVLPESSDAQAAAVAQATGLELVQPVSTRTRGGGTALLVRPSWRVDGSVADLHLTRHQNPVAQLGGTDGVAGAGGASGTGGPPVPFTMMGVHTNAPAHGNLVGGWTREMRDLRTWASGVDGPVVLAGDFNATTAHPELRRLTGDGSGGSGDTDGTDGTGALTDCGGGLFAAPTWPRAGFPSPVPVLRLDHVLVSGMTCAASGVVGVPGSDHAGVWADLRV